MKFDNTYNVVSLKTLKEKGKEIYTINIYPNASIEEVKRNAEDMGQFPYGPRKEYKRYEKGEFRYSIVDGYCTALYLPSIDKPLKIMFQWNPSKRKWILLSYKEGDR